MERGWKPSLGAWIEGDGTRFRVWAPEARELSLVLESPGGRRTLAMRKEEGYFTVRAPGVGAGARYRYRVDGRGPFPDPASRCQPEGVHGPSEVIDPRAHAWQCDGRQSGVRSEDLVLYELHVG